MARMVANGELILKDEAFVIVGAAMEVHSLLDPGFLEGVYGDALAIEFTRRGIPFQRESPINLHDKGILLPHTYRADFLAFDQIILELKAIKSLGALEQAQTLHYLKATGQPLALLVNFGAPKLDWKRLVLTN